MHQRGLIGWVALLTAMAVSTSGCAHTQRPERKVHVIHENAASVGYGPERGTGGSGAEAYCNELQKQCFKQCWNRKPATSSIPKHSEKHHEYCTEKCLNDFMKCVQEQEELERQESQKKALGFPSMDAALHWLEEHSDEAPPGTSVAVAGVLFVVAVVAGALVLSPL
jgi:hypothetical protein